VLAQGRELDVTAADRLRRLRCLRSNRGRSHYGPFGAIAAIRTRPVYEPQSKRTSARSARLDV